MGVLVLFVRMVTHPSYSHLHPAQHRHVNYAHYYHKNVQPAVKVNHYVPYAYIHHPVEMEGLVVVCPSVIVMRAYPLT